MEDFFWNITNPIFELILWLLLSKEGPKYLPYIFSITLVTMIYFLIKLSREENE